MSKWIAHIKSVRKANKGMSYKDAMKLAAKSYKSTGHSTSNSKSRKSCMKACKKAFKKSRKKGRGSKQWGGNDVTKKPLAATAEVVEGSSSAAGHGRHVEVGHGRHVEGSSSGLDLGFKMGTKQGGGGKTKRGKKRKNGKTKLGKKRKNGKTKRKRRR